MREPDITLMRVIGVDYEAGDLAAFYRRTYSGLVGLLSAIGGRRDEAEEVAHDAFAALVPRWEQIRDYDNPEAWVRTVAVRSLISRQRRARVRSLGLARLAMEPFSAGREPNPDSVAVARALEALPAAHRAVVVMHHALDLPVDVVARELGVPVGTVKSRLTRARAALRPLLEDEESRT